MVQRFLSVLSAVLLTTGTVQGIRGGWIHAKAGLAQVLLHLRKRLKITYLKI